LQRRRNTENRQLEICGPRGKVAKGEERAGIYPLKKTSLLLDNSPERKKRHALRKNRT